MWRPDLLQTHHCSACGCDYAQNYLDQGRPSVRPCCILALPGINVFNWACGSSLLTTDGNFEFILYINDFFSINFQNRDFCCACYNCGSFITFLMTDVGAESTDMNSTIPIASSIYVNLLLAIIDNGTYVFNRKSELLICKNPAEKT